MVPRFRYPYALLFLLVLVLAAISLRTGNAGNPDRRPVPVASEQELHPELFPSVRSGTTGIIPMEEVVTLGGAVNDVEVRGNFAYITEGKWFKVLNIGDPAAPGVTGLLELPAGTGNLQLYQNYVYLTARPALDDHRVYIIDITNPTAPALAGSFAATDAFHLLVAGTRLYVSAGSQLSIFSLATPSDPLLLGTYTAQAGIQDMRIVGSRAYLVHHNVGIEVADVSDPAAPGLLGTYANTAARNTIEVYGEIAYLPIATGLLVLDTSNPAAITPLVQVDDFRLRSLWALRRVGNYLYISATGRAIYAAEASVPTTLTIVGEFSGQEPSVFDFETAEGKLYAADRRAGLRVLDISNPAAISEAGLYTTWAYAPGLPVRIGNDHIYHLTDNGLQILDISEPARPRPLPVLKGVFSTYWWELAAAGNYAYFAPPDQGLSVINATNPGNPTVTTVLGSENFHDPLLVANGDLFVSMGDTIARLDLTNPAAPAIIAEVTPPTMGELAKFTVAGSYFFADRFDTATATGELLIYDISAPSAFMLVGSYPTSARFSAMAVSGGYLFAGSNYGDLFVFDVSAPATPTLAGTFDVEQNIYNQLLIEDDLLYVTGHPSTLVLDISEPSNPEPVARGPYYTHGMVRAGEFLYSTAGTLGTRVDFFVPPVRTVLPPAGGTLESPTDGVSYTFPSGVFNVPVTATHVRRFIGHIPYTPTLRPVNRFFEWSALDAADQPVEPVGAYSLTISYDETSLGFVDETTLQLYRLDAGEWTVVPDSTIDTASNTVMANPTATGTFALLGQSTLSKRSYLPLAAR